MKILHLLPTLQYCGAAREVMTLAPALAGQGHDVYVCSLGVEGPWGQRLRDQGVTVHVLNWTRGFDPTPLWKLHRLLPALQPELIHVWQRSALRALGLVGKAWLPRTVVSGRIRGQLRKLGRLDRWLLQRVSKILVKSVAEQSICEDLGLSGPKIVVVRPGVALEQGGLPLNLPPGQKVACIGPLEAQRGIREAIWTLDMIGFVFPDLHLIIAGAGPDEARLRRFAGHIVHSQNVHFVGPLDATGPLFSQVDLCWVPSLAAGGGAAVALEAQAAGCPVIASDALHLRDVVRDGETGLLAPPGDKVALGRCTRSLLLDLGLRRHLVETAQRRIERDFSVSGFVSGCLDLYRHVA